MLRNPLEVDVCREHHQFVSNAKLRVEHVDGSCLHAFASARISELSCGYVVFPIRYDQGEGGEVSHNGLPSRRARESLKKLLEDQARGENRLACLKGLFKPTNLGTRRWGISAQGQRPDAGVDEGAHWRERSAL